MRATSLLAFDFVDVCNALRCDGGSCGAAAAASSGATDDTEWHENSTCSVNIGIDVAVVSPAYS